jgi:MerR family redox-sensitive transcriptional activator SoxR
MSDYTIGEIARRTGVHPSAMRYYEQIGLLPSPRRVNGRRRYGADVLLSLRCIQLAQQAGFKLGEIRELLGGVAAATPLSLLWRQFAGHKLEELDEVIAQAQARQQMLSLLLLCECQTLEQCSFINEEADLCP